MRPRIALATALLALPCTSFATGILLPKDEKIPPLAIKHQRVDIDLRDGVANTKVEQVFQNSVNRDLEAVYVFPVPPGATVADFAMYINGKRMSGELVERDKARKIYQDIVRRMRDPGLLEHMGGELFRVSIYPVPRNGEQKVELTYSQTVTYESGMFHFVYPLRTGEKASRTLQDFTVRARLSTSVPLKNIYSPSHEVGISRKGDREAVIGFEEDRSLLDRDFVLYYSVSEKEFALNLLAHAPTDEDGFFMMMIAPTTDPELAKVLPKDITFVIDTSGSMAGEKIQQARDALSHCVKSLNKGDRFNIVRFSTDVDSLDDELLPVNEETSAKALKFIEKLRARGGTDIDSALRTALDTKTDKGRPYIVAFLTDGLPTIGTTEPDLIVKNATGKLASHIKVFVFGVGENVNTHLLDRIAGDSGGTGQYVKPGENIEVAVSSFYDKVSHPVLSKPTLDVGKVQIRDFYPKELPDLFCGGQVTVFGRYRKNGHVAVTLSGLIDGAKHDFVYETTFPDKETQNAFIPRLWATRKIGYLLDEIRLRGENRELKDEVVQLSKEYGIVTPYTSYLVLENDGEYAKHDIERRTNKPEAAARWARPAAETAPGDTAADEEMAGYGGGERDRLRGGREGGRPPEKRKDLAIPVFDDALAVAPVEMPKMTEGKKGLRYEQSSKTDVRRYLEKEEGAEAIQLSEAIDAYKRASAPATGPAAVKNVGKRMFYLLDGVWTDREFRKGMKTIALKYASDEYFRFIEKHPDLKPVFALGDRLVVCLDDKTAVVVE